MLTLANYLSKQNQTTLIRPNNSMITGLSFCIIIAFISYLSNQYIYDKISPLLWALVYSVIITNIFHLPQAVMGGVNFSSGQLLRFSIAVYGFTVSALAWKQLGLIGLFVVVIVIVFALFVGMYLGRMMGLSDNMSALIATGTGICGASAIAALGPSIEAKEEEMGMAVACITLFGLMAMFLYPVLFQSTIVGNWLNHSDIAFGVWAGTGIHETAQVVGSASQVSQEAIGVAMATKSIRIFAIAPVAVILSAIFSKRKNKGAGKSAAIPFFAIFFIMATLVNTLLLYLPVISEFWSYFSVGIIKPTVTFLLAVAFAGIGAKIRFKSFASLGYKAFITGFVTALLVSILALILVLFVFIPVYNI